MEGRAGLSGQAQQQGQVGAASGQVLIQAVDAGPLSAILLQPQHLAARRISGAADLHGRQLRFSGAAAHAEAKLQPARIDLQPFQRPGDALKGLGLTQNLHGGFRQGRRRGDLWLQGGGGALLHRADQPGFLHGINTGIVEEDAVKGISGAGD